MYIKWKNIFFWVLVIFLLIAILQQGNMLINNIKKTAIEFQIDQLIEVEDKKVENKLIEGNIAENKEKNNIFTNDFFKIIMKKTIPMMEFVYKINGENNNILLSLFSMTTK